MIVKLDDMPVIDWDANRKLAGNQTDLGDDMLALLAKSLVNELAVINEFHRNNMLTEMQASVHKLHGAVAYCGTPRLKAVLVALESCLRKKELTHIPELVTQLNIEAELVQKNCSKCC